MNAFMLLTLFILLTSLSNPIYSTGQNSKGGDPDTYNINYTWVKESRENWMHADTNKNVMMNKNAGVNIAQVVYVKGDSLVNTDTLPSLLAFTDKANGKITKLANARQIGSVWGLSYSSYKKELFVSAFAKRHCNFGPLGSGGIYTISPEKLVTKSYLNLNDVGVITYPTTSNKMYERNRSSISHDSLMFSLVGKCSIGGIDLTDDGKYLFLMNLFDRKLYRIHIPEDGSSPSKSDVYGYSLPNFEGRGGEFRPFAVKYYRDKVYVGAIHDASKSQKEDDLEAIVIALDVKKETFSTIFKTDLTYDRGSLDYRISKWRPWIDDYNKALVSNSGNWMVYPQPILADIEFDTDGSMILGLMDRLGHQTGDGQLFRPKGSKTLETYRGLSGGDVLRVAYRNGHYELERNAKAGNVRTAGRDNGQGPAGGEFYNDDQFTADGITWHQETATGGLALLPETDEVLISAREPVPGQYLTGGVKWLSNKTGKATRGLSVFPADARAGYFWKTNNVGDIELITEPAPIEVGDRVWHDQNGNGLQDADEPGLADIEVQLYQQNKLLATVKTNSEGYYHFKDGDVIDGIKPQNSYAIRIPLQQTGYTKLQVPILRNAATQQPSALPTDIDNDAQAIGDTAVINLTTGYAGQSIHNLDAGLQLATAIETQAARLQISPNPATTQTELTYRGYQANGAVTLQVRDAAGRLLQTQMGELKEGYFHQTIPVTQLIGGTYFISITEDSHSTSAPFVKP